MATPLRVLIVEDRPPDAELMLRELRQAGFDPDWQRVETEPDYLVHLNGGVDVILSDYNLPQFDGLRALHLLQEQELDIPFIVVTGAVGEEAAVECMRQGAADYLLKDRLARLGPAVRQALQKKVLRDEKQRVEQALREAAQISAALAQMGQQLIASLDAPTLLDRLCQLTTEVLGCDLSSTIFWRPEEEAYVVAAEFGHPAELRETLLALRVDRETFANLTLCLDAQEVMEVQAGAGHAPEALFQHFGATATLYLALRRGKELIGFQMASCRERNGFSLIQKRIAYGIAQLASLALENARLLEQAESASRLKSDFLATMSHELRTPLHIIMGYVGLLLEEEFGPLTAGQAEPLKKVDKSARELFELITATLEVSRLEEGRPPVQIGPVNVTDLIAELQHDTADHVAEKSGLTLEWHLALDLPLLRTDRTKLKVVLKNLITNAVKFTEQGSVTVGVRPWGGGVECVVSDTGIGIAPDIIPKIFDMFQQGDNSATRRYGGVGLGLYIVRRMLEFLGGRIAVESEMGKGSTFRVWVPGEETSR